MSSLQYQDLAELAQFFLDEIWPELASALHMIASALLPIYAGAHATLFRPTTAAKPRKRKRRNGQREPEETQSKMEGLTPTDALAYPLVAGLMLSGLYFLIKWLDDPKLISKILNWYVSIFGIFALTSFLTDAANVVQSFLLPTAYVRSGKMWSMSLNKRHFRARGVGADVQRYVQSDNSPLPPGLSALQVLPYVRGLVWKIREYLSTPYYVIDAYMHDAFEASIAVGPTVQFSFLFAICGSLYFILVDKPWWLINTMGFSYCYAALQVFSPTTFATGTLILFSLFFYDIFFVFYTPMMVTVATELDIPMKLLIPRPTHPGEEPAKAMSILGLGDIVLPGMMIGIALRFDLYLFYLKKQIVDIQATGQRIQSQKHETRGLSLAPGALVFDSEGVGKLEFKQATGHWGERFWLGRHLSKHTGPGCFRKTYFYASVYGYIVGMAVTISAVMMFEQGQPALLYLVPAVLIAQWGTAYFKGDLKTMWNYTELEESQDNKEKEDDKKAQIKSTTMSETADEITKTAVADETNSNVGQELSTSDLPVANTEDEWSDNDANDLSAYENLPITRPTRSIFSLSISSPPPREGRKETGSSKSASTDTAT